MGECSISIQVPRGGTDSIIDQMIGALRVYAQNHSQAQIDLYRQNRVSVRVRIIDPDFAGRGKSDRHDDVWRYFDVLPDETVADLSTLILLTPDETARSFANFEFDDPVPSTL